MRLRPRSQENTRSLTVEGIATANFDFASLNEANQIAEATEMGVVFGNAGDLSPSMLVFIDEPGPRPTWPAVTDERRKARGLGSTFLVGTRRPRPSSPDCA